MAKLEAEAYRSSQQQEYDNLKKTFEQHKKDQLDEKRMLMTEYQGLLYSMQSQFDEYRLTSEFLFNTELARVEDELALQAMRYEQEIMYIIHAKDKFYTEMMVSKDAKIMSLIEGSDLQSIMQKNEMVCCLPYWKLRFLIHVSTRIWMLCERSMHGILSESKLTRNQSRKISCQCFNDRTAVWSPSARSCRRT